MVMLLNPAHNHATRLMFFPCIKAQSIRLSVASLFKVNSFSYSKFLMALNYMFPLLMTSQVLLLFIGLPAQYSVALTAAMRCSCILHRLRNDSRKQIYS